MRLIDADSLKRTVNSRLDMQDTYLPVHFFSLVDDTPTVDVVTTDYYFKRIKEMQDRIDSLEEKNATQNATIRKLLGDRAGKDEDNA